MRQKATPASESAPPLDGEAAATSDPFPFHEDRWWSKALVLTIIFLPLAAIGYVVWRLWGDHVSALDLWLLGAFWAFTGLGISVGFHRMLTHRAFEARPVTRFFLLV